MPQMLIIERACPPSAATVGQSATAGWDSTLERYHRTAAAVLDRHVKGCVNCAACGRPWPCSWAAAAAFALEL